MNDGVKAAVIALLEHKESLHINFHKESLHINFHTGASIGYIGWEYSPFYAQKRNKDCAYFATPEEAWVWLVSSGEMP